MAPLNEEPNAGKPWTGDEINTLRALIEAGVPTRQIAWRLGRSEYSVRTKATQARISLRGGELPRSATRRS